MSVSPFGVPRFLTAAKKRAEEDDLRERLDMDREECMQRCREGARSRSHVQGLRRHGYSSGYSSKGGRGRGHGVKRDSDIRGPGRGLHRGRGRNPLLQEFQQRLHALVEGP